MKKERKDESFIKNPYYKDGDKALKAFVAANLKYPKSVLEGKIKGKVHLKYSIDTQGNVMDVRIIGGLDEACNAEAIRVVKLLKFVVPKNPKKLKIVFHKNITIHFKLKSQVQKKTLPIQPASPIVGQFQYALVKAKVDTPVIKEKPKAVIYNYTIKY